MLVIARKKSESILLGDDIEITITNIDNGTVKLAIKAPREVTILRKELYVEVENENKEAAKVDLAVIKGLSGLKAK
jgi:carbon storage regulator